MARYKETVRFITRPPKKLLNLKKQIMEAWEIVYGGNFNQDFLEDIAYRYYIDGCDFLDDLEENNIRATEYWMFLTPGGAYFLTGPIERIIKALEKYLAQLQKMVEALI